MYNNVHNLQGHKKECSQVRNVFVFILKQHLRYVYIFKGVLVKVQRLSVQYLL